MNEEERIIISRRTRSAMTYRVYEDREGLTEISLEEPVKELIYGIH